MNRFDPCALLDLTPGDSDVDKARELGVSYRTVMRWRHNGHRLNPWAADRLAVTIGRHPAEVWPDYGAAS